MVNLVLSYCPLSICAQSKYQSKSEDRLTITGDTIYGVDET